MILVFSDGTVREDADGWLGTTCTYVIFKERSLWEVCDARKARFDKLYGWKIPQAEVETESRDAAIMWAILNV